MGAAAGGMRRLLLTGAAVTEIKATGSQHQERAVAQALSRAYDRRMGR